MNEPSDEQINERYLVTKDGVVINKKTMRTLTPVMSNAGYWRVNLYINSKTVTRSIHRLVAIRWINNKKGKPCVNHLDGNKLNNDADNLEWVTYKENNAHAIKNGLHNLKGEKSPFSKLTEKDVKYIRKRIDILGKDMAEKFSVSRTLISRIRTGKAWKHLVMKP